jgi:hypothetical protein
MQTELLALGIDYRTRGRITPDLRQGRAVPPDPQGIPGQAASGGDDPGAAGSRGPVHLLLQRGEASPGQGALHPQSRLRRAGQGEGLRTEDPHRRGRWVRRGRIDKNGKVTLRHRTRLHHIGVGHAHKNKRVILLVHHLDIRVLSEDGELLRRLTLDPTRDYQPQR